MNRRPTISSLNHALATVSVWCALSSSAFAQTNPPPPAAPPAEVAPAKGVLATLTSVLTPSLLGELDYRVYSSEVEGNTGFALARLRPGMQLRPVPWFTAVATLEFASEHPQVLDAFMRLRAAKWAEFTVGYSKPPLFASFIYEPVYAMPFPDRAPVVTSFRVRRDLGVDVHLSPRSIPIEAWARVGNGTSSALGNDNALPAGYLLLDVVLGRAWAGASAGQQTFGLRAGSSAFVESSRDRDGIFGQTPFGFVYYRPNVVSGLRVVGEAHIIAYAGPLRFTGEAAMARENRSRDDDGNPETPRLDLPNLHSYGATTELAWVMFGERRRVGRPPSGQDDPDGSWNGGALEVAARYDGLWLGEGAPDVESGGSQGGSVALKWWPQDFLASTLAGYATHYTTAPIEEPTQFWSWGMMARASFFWGQAGQAGQAPTPGRAQ